MILRPFTAIALTACCLLIQACAGGVASSGGRICTLSADKKTFLCDVEFQPAAGSCEPGAAARREFLLRMTSVSLEMLYLDREPGGQPPFHYHDFAAASKQIEVVSCRGSCECRMKFTDESLEEIFYDSAGCRSRSKLENHPLYFRGRGCR